MSSLSQFIRSRTFFVHLGLIALSLIVIFFGVIKWLSFHTNHSEFVQVPDFKGIETGKLASFISSKEIGFEIIDSIYDPKQKAGIVLKQDPESGTKVKHNRKVYLYVTGLVPPQVNMPKLIDRSERQARLIITSYGLKTGKVSTRPSDCNGCVIAQLNGGKDIVPGQPVKKGSSIDLIIGVKDSYQVITAADTAKKEEVNFDNADE